MIRPGTGVVAIGSGPVVLTELLRAAELLRTDGIDMTVVNLPWLNRVDPGWLSEICGEAAHVVVVENHFTRGGQADMLARALLELRTERLPSFRGVGLTELPHCGTEDEALDAHGLSAARLAEVIRAEARGEFVDHPFDVALRAA